MNEKRFNYTAHEWFAAMDGVATSKTDVVCGKCGARVKIGNWPQAACSATLAPESWFPKGNAPKGTPGIEWRTATGTVLRIVKT